MRSVLWPKNNFGFYNGRIRSQSMSEEDCRILWHKENIGILKSVLVEVGEVCEHVKTVGVQCSMLMN